MIKKTKKNNTHSPMTSQYILSSGMNSYVPYLTLSYSAKNLKYVVLKPSETKNRNTANGNKK